MWEMTTPIELPRGSAVALIDTGWLLQFNEYGFLIGYRPPRNLRTALRAMGYDI